MKGLQLFFPYYGGKWRSVKHYPLPKHDTIIEPFAGAAGYSLRYPDRKILLYDINPTICGIWDYLIKVKEKEILALPSVIEDIRNINSIPDEAKSLIGFWLNKGSKSPCNVPSKWMRDDMLKGQRTTSYWGEAIKERIANQLPYIRHWEIEKSSYTKIPDRQACWFVDPPYKKSGKAYPHHHINYDSLATWCMERKGQIIVCEQRGADWLPFWPLGKTKSLEGSSHEVLFQRINNNNTYGSEILLNLQKSKKYRRDVSFYLDEKTYETFLCILKTKGINGGYVIEELMRAYLNFHS